MAIRVLLADDHTLVRQGILSLMASAPDFRIVGEAGTGFEVLEKVPSLDPDLVIVDIAMPCMNGIETTRLLKLRHPAVRVVVLSIHGTVEHVHLAFEAGAWGYLLKEDAFNELVTALLSVHRGTRYISPRMMKFIPLLNDKVPSPLNKLSVRERQVLQFVVEGLSSSTISKLLNISPKSVETYRSRLMTKLHVDSLPLLVKFALAHGLTTQF